MVVTVAMSEDWLLSDWRKTLRTDAIVAGVLLCMILLLAALLVPAVPLPQQDRARAARARGALPPAREQHRRHHHPDRCPQPAALCFAVGRAGAGTAPEGPGRQIMLRPGASRRQGERQIGDRTAQGYRQRQHGRVPDTIAATERWRGSKASSSWRRNRATPPGRNFSASSATSPSASGWRMS